MAEQVVGFAPIVGRWSIDNGKAEYLGGSDPPYGICVSAAQFLGGQANVSVTLSEHATISGRLLFDYRSPQEPYYTIGLGGYDAAYVLSRYDPAIGWSAVKAAGRQDQLQSNEKYSLAIQLEGQRITLNVNGIRVIDAGLPTQPIEGQLGLFAWGNAKVAFSDLSTLAKQPVAFVVMPLDGQFQALYDSVIKPTALEFDLRAFHAAEVYGPGSILNDIVDSIIKSKIVIAEISTFNPNVFYEIGYAHALQKPTILLAQRGQKLPFDISGYRCIFYENTIGGKKSVEEALRKHLTAILG